MYDQETRTTRLSQIHQYTCIPSPPTAPFLVLHSFSHLSFKPCTKTSNHKLNELLTTNLPLPLNDIRRILKLKSEFCALGINEQLGGKAEIIEIMRLEAHAVKRTFISLLSPSFFSQMTSTPWERDVSALWYAPSLMLLCKAAVAIYSSSSLTRNPSVPAIPSSFHLLSLPLPHPLTFPTNDLLDHDPSFPSKAINLPLALSRDTTSFTPLHTILLLFRVLLKSD